MRRKAIGILAAALLLGAVVLTFLPSSGEVHPQLLAACWRVGALMLALWIAYPEVQRMPGWIWGAIPALAVVLAWRPRLFLIAVPVVIALAILKPRIGARR